jgi:hypothetical protein
LIVSREILEGIELPIEFFLYRWVPAATPSRLIAAASALWIEQTSGTV